MPFRSWREPKSFLSLSMGCGDVSGVLGSYACVSMFYDLLGTRELVDAVPSTMVKGASYKTEDGVPIRWAPACQNPYLFHSSDSKTHVGVDDDCLISFSEKDGRTRKYSIITPGDVGWDVWTHGPWGCLICMHGGVAGVDEDVDVTRTASIEWDELPFSDVFGGMLEFLSRVNAEAIRTGAEIEKHL